MSTKQPNQSSDDVGKFIDDVAVEDNGEEGIDDDEEEDPDQSEPSSSYS